MFASPAARARSDDAMKGSRKCCLVSEAALRRYINERELGFTEEIFGAIDA